MHQTNEKRGKTRNGRYLVIGSICGAVAIAVVVFLFIMTGNRERVVGVDIAAEDITEFFYTYSSSTYPPDYQRYRLYKENGIYKFYHEKREGQDWPLTEAHITISGSVELSEEEWKEFLSCINGGKVKERNQESETGGSGPWLYLYWKGDGGKYQEFSFLTVNEKNSFEEFCEELVTAHTEESETVVPNDNHS